MQKSIQNVLSLKIWEKFLSLKVIISVNNTAHILHGTSIVIRYEDLIKLIKGIWSRKELLIEINAALCHIKPLIFALIQMLQNGLSTVHLQRKSITLNVLLIWQCSHVWSSNHRIKVAADRFCQTKFIAGDVLTIEERGVLCGIQTVGLQLVVEVFGVAVGCRFALLGGGNG